MSADVRYPADQRICVFDGWQANATEVDPVFVDWAQVKPRNVYFKLRLDPGPWNALGRIKFMSPKKFDVYWHDILRDSAFRSMK